MSNLIIVDRLLGFDRFNLDYNKTSYFLYGKKTISIPEKMQLCLLNVIRRRNLSIKDEIQWISCGIYCSFFAIERELVAKGIYSSDNKYHDPEENLNIYNYIEEAINTIDFEELYSYLDVNDNINWTKLCGYIHDQIKNYAVPKIISGKA